MNMLCFIGKIEDYFVLYYCLVNYSCDSNIFVVQRVIFCDYKIILCILVIINLFLVEGNLGKYLL